MNPIKKWNQLGLFTRIMVGFVLGIAAGLIFGEKATKLAFLGTILTRLLTMVVAPLVLGLLICSAADVKDFKTLGKIGGKTLGIFLGGTAIAVAIGLVLCNIMQIGAGFVMESAQAYDAKEIPSIVDTLMDIIPTNPFNSLSTQNLLQIIFFSLLLGFALIKLGEKGEPVLNFFRAWTEAWKEITNIVLEFTPYGVFGLMANIVGKYGMGVMLPYMKTIDAYEEKYKYELPLIHKEFMSKYDGLSLDNGCTFYSLEELDAMNKDLQVNIYQPDIVAVGDDGGDLVFLMKQEKEAKTVYLVDAGDYDLESPYQIIPDFNKWMEKGFEIEDIDGEDVRGVDYGDLYLIKMPKEGVKGLVTIKRAFNLEMSTGELLQKSKSLPTKLLSNITSSKANIIAEKIGMPGLFEIR